MRVFRDNRGRLWTVAIDVAAVERVRGIVGVDLIEAVSGGLMARFAADLALVVDVLYAVCLDQADRRGVSDAAFGKALIGKDRLANAASALRGELLDFFPSARDGANKDRAAKVPTADEIRGLIWRSAGVVGVDPGPLTLRQLLAMADARGHDEWQRTASVLAMLFNAHRDPRRTDPASPDDFNPFARRQADENKLTVPPKLANKLMFEDSGSSSGGTPDGQRSQCRQGLHRTYRP